MLIALFGILAIVYLLIAPFHVAKAENAAEEADAAGDDNKATQYGCIAALGFPGLLAIIALLVYVAGMGG